MVDHLDPVRLVVHPGEAAQVVEAQVAGAPWRAARPRGGMRGGRSRSPRPRRSPNSGLRSPSTCSRRCRTSAMGRSPRASRTCGPGGAARGGAGGATRAGPGAAPGTARGRGRRRRPPAAAWRGAPSGRRRCPRRGWAGAGWGRWAPLAGRPGCRGRRGAGAALAAPAAGAVDDPGRACRRRRRCCRCPASTGRAGGCSTWGRGPPACPSASALPHLGQTWPSHLELARVWRREIAAPARRRASLTRRPPGPRLPRAPSPASTSSMSGVGRRPSLAWRMIFSCSLRMPCIRASGRGGQPPM